MNSAKVERTIPTAHDAGDDEHGDQLMVDADVVNSLDATSATDRGDEEADVDVKGDGLKYQVLGDRQFAHKQHKQAYETGYGEDIPAQLVGDSVIQITRRRSEEEGERRQRTAPQLAVRRQENSGRVEADGPEPQRGEVGGGGQSTSSLGEDIRQVEEDDGEDDEVEDKYEDDDIGEGLLEDRMWSGGSKSFRQRTNVLLAAA